MNVRLFHIILFFLLTGSTVFGQPWHILATPGGPSNDIPGVLVQLPDGDLILGMSFSDSLILSDTTIVSLGDRDAAWLRIDTITGSEQLFATGSSPLEDLVDAAVVHRSGNLTTSGRYWLEGTFGDTSLIARSGRSIFLNHYDPDGRLIWGQSIDGAVLKASTDLRTDLLDNIYLCGFFSDTLFVTGDTLIANGNSDAFLFRFQPNGTLDRAVSWGGTDNVRALGMGIDPAGFLTVGGVFDDTLFIGDTLLTANTRDRDLFIIQWDELGTLQWVRKAGGVFDKDLSGLEVDSFGNILLAGHLRGVMRLDDSTQIQSSTIEPDLFLLGYRPDGTLYLAQTFPGTGEDQALDMQLYGDVLSVSGFFEDSLYLDNFSIFSPNTFDGFFMQVDPQTGRGMSLYLLATDELILPELLNRGPKLWIGGAYSGMGLTTELSLPPAMEFDLFIVRPEADVVSTEDYFLKDPFLVFPNPATSLINIDANGRNIEAIQLFDMQGRFIKTAASTSIPVEHLPMGNYVLRWTHENNRFQRLISIIRN